MINSYLLKQNIIKPLLCSFSLLVAGELLNAQTLKVMNRETDRPLEAVHVYFRALDVPAEKVLLTDTAGKLKFDLKGLNHALFEITLKALGFETLCDTFIPSLQHRIYYLKPESMVTNSVVITAQYAPNSPEKAVHKINIIDRKKIEAMGAQNLRDVLSNEMNIRISQDNVLGSSMSLQGISGQNVKILIDGVPVTGRLNGNIDISQINMYNVERIEIVEGPLSVNYGTDALAGTINIITRKNVKRNFSLSSNNYYESCGQYNFSGNLSYRKRNNNIMISGGRNYFDGWRYSDPAFYIERPHIADSTRYKNWKSKEQIFGSVYYGTLLGRMKVMYNGDYFYEQIVNRGLPRLPYYETAFDDYYTTGRIGNTINFNGALNQKLNLSVLTAYNYYQRIKNTFLNDLTTLQSVLTENSGDQDTGKFRNLTARGSINSHSEKAKLNYEMGYDINHETGIGIRIAGGKKQIGDYALFFTSEYRPFKNMLLRPGLRIIYNTAYQAPLIPSLNIRYAINDKNTLRVSYAKGFRAPSVKELYFFFVDINHNITGNKDLKAEQSHNFNLAYTHLKRKQNALLKIEASVFYNSISNMISLAQLSGTKYTYFNVEEYRTSGLQGQGELAWKHLKLSLGATYTGRYNQLHQKNTDLQKFTYSPEARFNFYYEWYRYHTTFALFYKYNGKLPSFMSNENNEILRTVMNDYHTADVSVSKSVFSKKVNISAGVKNLFNVKNVSGVVTGAAHASASNLVTIGMGRICFVKLDFYISSRS